MTSRGMMVWSNGEVDIWFFLSEALLCKGCFGLKHSCLSSFGSGRQVTNNIFLLHDSFLFDMNVRWADRQYSWRIDMIVISGGSLCFFAGSKQRSLGVSTFREVHLVDIFLGNLVWGCKYWCDVSKLAFFGSALMVSGGNIAQSWFMIAVGIFKHCTRWRLMFPAMLITTNSLFNGWIRMKFEDSISHICLPFSRVYLAICLSFMKSFTSHLNSPGRSWLIWLCYVIQ